MTLDARCLDTGLWCGASLKIFLVRPLVYMIFRYFPEKKRRKTFLFVRKTLNLSLLCLMYIFVNRKKQKLKKMILLVRPVKKNKFLL